MALNLTVIKKHPIATGAIVIVGGVALFLVMRGGGSTVIAASGGPSEALLSQQAQMQFAAAQQSSAQNFQLAMQSGQIQGQLLLAEKSLEGRSEEIAAALAATTGQIELAKYQANLAYMAQQDANATAKQMQKAQLQATVDLSAQQTAALTRQAELAAQTRMFETAAFTDVQKLYYQGQTELGIVQSNNQVKIEGIQADAQKYIAKKQGQSSMFGSLVGLAGTALSFFSDPRLKSDIQRRGQLEDGTPIYNYRMLGVIPRSGVMAPEVRWRRPNAAMSVMGIGMVDYGQVMQGADPLAHYRRTA